MKNFTRNQLEIGNWIEYQGEIYNFIGIDKTKSTNYLLQNYETKINFPVSYNDLCTSEPEIIIAKSKADLDKKILAISEHAENQLNCFSETSPYYIKAKEIFDIVRIIDDNLYFIEQEKIKNQINSRNGEISFPKINKTEILIRLCEEYGISKSTYYNYKKKDQSKQ